MSQLLARERWINRVCTVTFNLLSSHDPSMVAIAVDTLGVIGETAAGKRARDKQGMYFDLKPFVGVIGESATGSG